MQTFVLYHLETRLEKSDTQKEEKGRDSYNADFQAISYTLEQSDN